MEIQYALRHSMDPAMNSDLALFSTSRVTDRHRLKRDHRVEAHHLCSKDDTAVRLLFPHADIKFYEAFNIGHKYVCVLDLIETRRSQMTEALFFAWGKKQILGSCGSPWILMDPHGSPYIRDLVFFIHEARRDMSDLGVPHLC